MKEKVCGSLKKKKWCKNDKKMQEVCEPEKREKNVEVIEICVRVKDVEDRKVKNERESVCVDRRTK